MRKNLLFKAVRGLCSLTGLFGLASLFVAGTCDPPNLPKTDWYACSAFCTPPGGLPTSEGLPFSATYCSNDNDYEADCLDHLDPEGVNGCDRDDINYLLIEANGCPSTQPSGHKLSGGVPNSTELSVDYGMSFIVVFYNGQSQAISANGDVKFTGGCNMTSCGISFNHVLLTADDLSVGGLQITDILIVNNGVMTGTQSSNNISIPSTQVKVIVNADVGGTHQVLEFTPPTGQNPYGFYDPSTGSWGLSGAFYATFGGYVQEVDFDLLGVATSRPPVADAGAPQNATALPGIGLAMVTLNGSLTSDLDGDLDEIRWYEGSTYLGSGTTLNRAFSVGTHNVRAYAIDSTGKWSFDDTTVTVTP